MYGRACHLVLRHKQQITRGALRNNGITHSRALSSCKRLHIQDDVEVTPAPRLDTGPAPTALEDSSSQFQQNSEAPVNSLRSGLLDVPPPVKGWPTPWLAPRELDAFIAEMSTRGWTFQPLASSDASDILLSTRPRGAGDQSVSGTPPSKKKQVLHAITQYPFSSYDAALEFVNKVGRIASGELHHPEMTVTSSNNVLLWMTTHSARPGREWAATSEATSSNQDDSATSAKDKAVKPPHLRKVPGLTRRDSRLAVLIENLYNSEYSSGSVPGVGREPFAVRASSRTIREHLIAQIYGRSMTAPTDPVLDDDFAPVPSCAACGGEHPVSACEMRAQHPPRIPCQNCGEGHHHWVVDCPQDAEYHAKRDKAATSRSQGQDRERPRSPRQDGQQQAYGACRACGSIEHEVTHCRKRRAIRPPKPCRLCGGDHWVYDCEQFSPCPACGGDHTLFHCIRRSFIPPNKPCSLCGEKHRHWLVDCPLYVDRHEAKHREHRHTREEKVMREVLEGKGRDGKHLQRLLRREGDA